MSPPTPPDDPAGENAPRPAGSPDSSLPGLAAPAEAAPAEAAPADAASEDAPAWTVAHHQNRRAWDEMVRGRKRFTRPARDEDFRNPLATVDGLGWLGGDIRGRRLLALAAGGGRQSVLYAAAGAEVTVVDISPAMLELDRQVAAERGLAVRTVEASMDHLVALADASFDIVIHPVSSCYVPRLEPVYREVARVTRPGGVYISQHKQPASLQTQVKPTQGGYLIEEPYYRSAPLPPVIGSRHREEGTLEYLHRWEELIGGLCRSGFVVEDLVEPLHAEDDAASGTFAHRSRYVAPYVRIKARRVASAPPGQEGPAAAAAPRRTLWLPD